MALKALYPISLQKEIGVPHVARQSADANETRLNENFKRITEQLAELYGRKEFDPSGIEQEIFLLRDAVRALEDERYTRNLLHNWDFRNPVNQRGASGTITATGYFIDRWKLTSGSVTLESTGLTLNGTIVQISEYAWGTNVTASVRMVSGTATITYDNTTKTTTVTSSGGVIEAVKLEYGGVSTLANDPPADYGEQLALCQRFFTYIGSTSVFTGIFDSTTQARLYIPLPVSMRISAPTITMPSSANLTCYASSANAQYTITGFSTSRADRAYMIAHATISSATAFKTWTSVSFRNEGYWDVSADL